MENKNNQPIDDFFDEIEHARPSDETKDEEKENNYFNDYRGGEKTQASGEKTQATSCDNEQIENDQKNQEQPFSNGEANQVKADGYFNNMQNGATYGATSGTQGGGLLKDDQKYSALGVVSMVLGIVSIVSCCLAGASVVLAIIALVLSIMRMSVKADGFAIAGLVTGILGFLVNTLFLIALIAGAGEQTTAFAVYTISQALSKFMI